MTVKRTAIRHFGLAIVGIWLLIAPAVAATPVIGSSADDGTVFAGVSPDTGKDMYMTPAEAPQPLKWEVAVKYCSQLDSNQHHDWRVPTKNELNGLYSNRTAFAGFVPLGEDVNQWYWTSEETNQYFVWAQRFSDGNQNFFPKETFAYIRCVRG